MVDIHCHILPGIDDGAPDLDASLAMALVAAGDGITTIAATPHVRDDHPFDLTELPERRAELAAALAKGGLDIEIVQGAEVAIEKVGELSEVELRGLCIGGGTHLLVESPYSHALGWLEDGVYEAQRRGFEPILAHPERCPSFQAEPARLGELVENGVLCSLTAASLAGQFGRTVRSFATELLSRGWAHNIASDAHDPSRRSPRLSPGVHAAASTLPSLDEHGAWFTTSLPEAIVRGIALPSGPPPLAARGPLARMRPRLFGTRW
jgi:protein-tyrosine phosphatase